MDIADKWKSQDMAELAAGWLREINSGETVADGFGSAVVLMNFTAPPETQWEFLQAAVNGAETEDQLCAIAAGPFEHLLGSHGETYIDRIEDQCRRNEKFARMTTAAYRHKMSDDVWSRVQAIQAAVPDPL